MRSTPRLLSLSLLFFVFACSKNNNDNNTNNVHSISASLSGANETPAVVTSATGTLTGSYDAGTKTLTYNLSWSNLSGTATSAHFHGPAGTSAPAGVLVPITITNNAATGSATGSVVIADSVVTFLSQGNVYVNVHTAAKPAGEIRGQVSFQ